MDKLIVRNISIFLIYVYLNLLEIYFKIIHRYQISTLWISSIFPNFLSSTKLVYFQKSSNTIFTLATILQRVNDAFRCNKFEKWLANKVCKWICKKIRSSRSEHSSSTLFLYGTREKKKNPMTNDGTSVQNLVEEERKGNALDASNPIADRVSFSFLFFSFSLFLHHFFPRTQRLTRRSVCGIR